MVMDHYRERYDPYIFTTPNIFYSGPEVTRAEFDKLREDVSEMLKLLRRAKKYDKDNHEPNCENEKKVAVLRAVAKAAGVDLDKELAT